MAPKTALLTVVAALFLTALLVEISLSNSFAEKDQYKEEGRRLTQSGGLDCAALCATRCSVHSRPKMCIRACGTCCSRCGCVPPGTSGMHDLCGTCYANMTTHSNRLKCP